MTSFKPQPLDPLVLQNRLAVSLSQKRKLVSSWLPPPTADELANQKSVEELAAQENEIWRCRPATLGVGHPIPSSSSTTSNYDRETEALRRRLLGKNALSDARQRHLERTQSQSTPDNGDNDDSSDGEEQMGRGIGSKRSSKRRKLEGDPSTPDETPVDEDGGSGGFVSLTSHKNVSSKKKKKAKTEKTLTEKDEVENSSSETEFTTPVSHKPSVRSSLTPSNNDQEGKRKTDT
ncbi:hypothetical protein TWF694_000049 [Orbilia ellipsospora]|uniref:Uncharacterized protein n=1 Tax=Orbilia ellipsospora TaxID=2528407 RepID=A0AAV9XMG5_9PEZI